MARDSISHGNLDTILQETIAMASVSFDLSSTCTMETLRDAVASTLAPVLISNEELINWVNAFRNWSVGVRINTTGYKVDRSRLNFLGFGFSFPGSTRQGTDFLWVRADSLLVFCDVFGVKWWTDFLFLLGNWNNNGCYGHRGLVRDNYLSVNFLTALCLSLKARSIGRSKI